jgi:hypothetical protein
VCQSIDSQSVGSSSGPFSTATPDDEQDGDDGAADVAAELEIVMPSNLSFGSGSLSVFLHRLT